MVHLYGIIQTIHTECIEQDLAVDVTDGQLEKGVAGLNSAAGFIQSSIAKKLRIRQFPKLTFVVDSGMKEGFAMVKKLNELEKSESAVSSDESDAE